MSFIFVLFMLLLLTVCALYVCLCDYVNMCMYLVLLCIFGKKLLRACVYCLQKPNSNKVFLSYSYLTCDGVPWCDPPISGELAGMS